MALLPEHYAGREQALVKHHFLKHYLESLIHKIASVYGGVVYVDGFSGPWQHRGERFEDTSFGIALQVLADAKRSWANMTHRPRQVRVTAHLVEKDPTAYCRLSELSALFPGVDSRRAWHQHAPPIRQEVGFQMRQFHTLPWLFAGNISNVENNGERG